MGLIATLDLNKCFVFFYKLLGRVRQANLLCLARREEGDSIYSDLLYMWIFSLTVPEDQPRCVFLLFFLPKGGLLD